ncbi:MAG TPA: MFS transporter [Acidimicrobiales bacterium]|nr:MFS transporter [Acidimicrobiales bacterium]
MKASPSRVLVPVLILIGMVTSVVSSLGAPLLPTIARVDHVSLGDAQWSLTVTMLVGAVTAPVLGRLGDGPARRAVILASLAAVVVGSVLAALPGGGFPLLLLGRGLHGFGLGLMPLTMAVARDSLPQHRAGPAIALLSIATVAGVGLGYPITGVLDENLGLHATFWFGAIVGSLALLVSLPVIPRSAHLQRRPLDSAGALLVGVALLALLLGITEGQPWGWGSARVVGLIVVGVVLGAAWVARERSVRHPLVDLGLLRHASVAVTNATALLIAMAMYMFIPLLTDFVQTPRSAGYGSGASVVTTGLMLLPFSALSTSMSRVAAALGARIGPERVVTIGALVMAVAVGLFAVAGGALWVGFVAMGICGIGVGFTFAAMPGLIVRSVPGGETGSALGFYQVVRYVGFCVGSGIATSILAGFTPTRHLLPDRTGFTVALTVGAAVCLVAAIVSASLGRGVSLRRSVPGEPVALDSVEEVGAEVVFE